MSEKDPVLNTDHTVTDDFILPEVQPVQISWRLKQDIRELLLEITREQEELV